MRYISPVSFGLDIPSRFHVLTLANERLYLDYTAGTVIMHTLSGVRIRRNFISYKVQVSRGATTKAQNVASAQADAS
jgi:hypothetical protein